MKKIIPKNKGLAIVETLLIIAVIVVIILLLVQRSRNSTYFMSGYRTTNTTTNSMGQTISIPSTSSTVYTTTTTTTNNEGIITHTNEKPVITLYGDNPYNIFHPGIIPSCEPGLTTKCPPRTDVYTEPGYKAIDKEDGDITSKVSVRQEQRDYAMDPGPCYEYTLLYSVTDSNGNIGTARRTVHECNGI